jgi:uncharacterized protein YggT (Ycf19 family)
LQPTQSVPSTYQPVQPDERMQPLPPVWPAEQVQPVQPVEPVAPLVQPVQPVAPPVQPIQSYGYGMVPMTDRPDTAARRLSPVSPTYRATQILYLLVGIVEVLIITRVVLKLLAANSGVGFARFVYGVSAPLVAPFQGIFPTPASNTNVLELSSLVAIVVYGLLAWGIVQIVYIVGRRPLSATAG